MRLSDAAVTQLLSVGDVVDVLGAERDGSAMVVADRLSIIAIPDGGDDSAWSSNDDAGLVVVAASSADALEVAGAAARGPLTVAVHP